eukprot:TRINITY_DN9450_c0_g1_i1.p1 TRINITY_DN9450_c0_g1~~TRINITY_DN9450_c0_g1_i1.p1  ORF type:complete len:528 (-),score=69.04 TRINITY_DN9450_c0_g1_i1:17-1561(-)
MVAMTEAAVPLVQTPHLSLWKGSDPPTHDGTSSTWSVSLPSASTPEPTNLQLLTWLSDNGAIPGCEVGAMSIEATGEEKFHDACSLSGLALALWPAADDIAKKCQTLRLLKDHCSRFTLKQTSHGFVVLTESVRAFVEPHRVIFLGPPTHVLKVFIGEFREALRRLLAEVAATQQTSKDEIATPKNTWPKTREFHIWVAECIMCSAVTFHQIRLRALELVVDSVTNNVKTDTSAKTAMDLYPLKDAVSGIIDRVRPLVQGMRAVSRVSLHSPSRDWSQNAPNDRSQSAWTFNANMPIEKRPAEIDINQAAEETTPNEASSVGNIETLGNMMALFDVLDNWKMHAEDVLEELVRVHQKVQDIVNFLHAGMDYSRNQLLSLELVALVFTAALSFGSMVSGIFGMNLSNRLQHKFEPYLFWAVVALILATMCIGVMCGRRYYGKSMSKYTLQSSIFGRNIFFKSIADDNYALSLDVTADGQLTEPSVDRVLMDLQAPALVVGPLSSESSTQSSYKRR